MRAKVSTFLLLIMTALLSAAAYGSMAALDDAELAETNAQGIALAFEDFRFQMHPRDYIEQIGSTPQSACTTTGSGLGNRNCSRTENLRFYGLSMTSSGAGQTFNGAACPSGESCPLGAGSIARLASFGDPYLLRAFSRSGLNFFGGAENRTVLELLGPTRTDAFKWSFMGEIDVYGGGIAQGNGVLQNQVIIQGSPTARTQGGAESTRQGTVLQLFRTAATNNNANATIGRPFSGDTLGIVWQSRLNGSFRFSASQTGTVGAGSLAGLPLFNQGTTDANAPGLKFKQVEAFLPLGQLHYQPLVLGATPADDGNFQIELTRVQNIASIYQDFYSLNAGCANSAGAAGRGCGYNRAARPARYFETHGYVRWGQGFTGGPGTDPTINSTTDGIIFAAPAGANFTARSSSNPTNANNLNVTTVTAANRTFANIGTARADGLLVQHLKITSLGAGP